MQLAGPTLKQPNLLISVGQKEIAKNRDMNNGKIIADKRLPGD